MEIVQYVYMLTPMLDYCCLLGELNYTLSRQLFYINLLMV